MTQEEKNSQENLEEEKTGNTNPANGEEETQTQEETSDSQGTAEGKENESGETYESLVQKNKQLYERAKKAEAQAKELKNQPNNKSNENESLSQDDVISLANLVASGVKTEVLNEAREQAKYRGISLQEALEIPSVKAYQEKLDKEETKENAQLGASNRGTPADEFRNVKSREEHKKLFEKYKNQS